jgi:hypothetical protein
LPVELKNKKPLMLTGNTVNKIDINTVQATAIRINFTHTSKQVAVSEIECY